MRKFLTMLLSGLLLFSAGCIGNDGLQGDENSPIEPCSTKIIDENLVGEWVQHTIVDFTPHVIEFNADGTRVQSNTDPDFEGLEFCWTTENHTLISGYHWDDQNTDQITNYYYNVDNDLFFITSISTTTNSGGITYETFSDRPTQCVVYSKEGSFPDDQTRNTAINSTIKPDFCTWIWADPAGSSPVDAWNATYLATDHSTSLSSGIDDNLFDIELDDFYGEIDWYVSEGYFGFWIEITVDNATHLCSPSNQSSCFISFSGIDEYYAVWEQGEIATISENGIDICSTTCDIEITKFGLREEDTLQGTTQLVIS
jgi:hypothetical protein